MRITYGKNVYGSEEISAVVKQLKKTTQMSDSVKEFEIKIAKIFVQDEIDELIQLIPKIGDDFSAAVNEKAKLNSKI